MDEDVRQIIGRDLGQIMDCLGVAEEELEGRDMPGLFAALYPTEPLRGKSEGLYRAHVRELIARAHTGDNLAHGTLAEVCGTLSDISLKAPLNPEGQAVQRHAFTACFPGRSAELYKDTIHVDQEKWPGQVLEDLSAMRRKLQSLKRGMCVAARGKQMGLAGTD